MANDHYIDIPTLAGSPFWKDAVLNFAALPAGQLVGEVRVTTSSGIAYEWDGSTWNASWTPGSTVGPASSTDGGIVLFNGTTGKLVKQATGSGFVKSTSGVYSVQTAVSLTSDVTGTLPIANGGTNSAATLSGSKAMVSSASAIVESATTATELGYVSGVTSAIQTQFGAITTSLSGKEPTITAGTTSQYWRGDKSFQTLQVSALVAITSGAAASTGAIGEILFSAVAANTATGVGATGTYGAVTNVALTAGSWMIWGTAGMAANGATLTTGLQAGISGSATGSGISEFDSQLEPYLVSGSSDSLISTPVAQVDISSTTTYYLNTRFWYTAGSPQHRGRIIARRIR